ncbi:hypothetical protein MHK_006843 [Candidatus Magnetomorum sp. HK-1]|nr:hypothetical protein MHK_006843 [Candidatus Magnetomorum sp. HK-1]
MLKSGITSFSMLWFRITQGTLLDIDRFGKKFYNDVVNCDFTLENFRKNLPEALKRFSGF